MVFEKFIDGLDFQIVFSRLDEIAFEIQEGKATYEEFFKCHRLTKLYLHCIAGGREELDWPWLYENGKFCNKDYDIFPDEMKEFGFEKGVWSPKTINSPT